MVKELRPKVYGASARIALMGCILVLLGCGATQQPATNDNRKADGQARRQRLAAPVDDSSEPDNSVLPQRPVATRPRPVTKQEGPAKDVHDASSSGPLEHLPVATWKPVVSMSAAHDAMCLRKIGDRLPPIELLDLNGKPHTLDSYYGDKLTVVVFWNSQLAFARDQYARLVKEVALPYSGAGVNAVAINIRQMRDERLPTAPETATGLVNLLDEDGHAFDQIATDKLPRTYLLDRFGTILWMDIEYSRGTRRELANAIRYYLDLET